MSSPELDDLLSKALGPVATPPSLERTLAQIPARVPQRRRWSWLSWRSGRAWAWSGGAAVLASALLLGLWTGAGHWPAPGYGDERAAALSRADPPQEEPSLDDLLLGPDFDDGDLS